MSSSSNRPTLRPTLRPILGAILLVAVFTTVGLFHTWLRIEGLRIGYNLSALTGEQRVLQRENQRLKLEVATLEAPARIERIARETLQMRAPAAGQVVVVRERPGAPTKMARRGEVRRDASEVVGPRTGVKGDG